MFLNDTSQNENIELSCSDSPNYRNPYNNFTCNDHKAACKKMGQILKADQLNELLDKCPESCNLCLNESFPSISFVKNNGSLTTLSSSEVTIVVVLGAVGLVAISSILIGLFVISKRSRSVICNDPLPLTRKQNRILFKEDIIGLERSVFGSSEATPSKSSDQISCDPAILLNIASSSSLNETMKDEDYTSPINNFKISKRRTLLQLGLKCFKYAPDYSLNALYPKENSSIDDSLDSMKNADKIDMCQSENSHEESGDEEAKVVHLLGGGKYEADGIGYCTTASSSEDM